MEFPGVGVVPLEPPSDKLKPFMRSKLKTWMRSFAAYRSSLKVIRRQYLLDEAKRCAIQFKAADRERAEKARVAAWDFLVMCDKNADSITEEEFVNAWINRAYSDAATRKDLMEKSKKYLKEFFIGADTNKDGVIDLPEFKAGSGILNQDTVQALFNAIDLNKDGRISSDEFLYMATFHHFSSGPDDVISTFFGPIIDD